MSYLKEFEDALFDCVSLVTSIPQSHIYFMYQSYPEPKGNCLALVANQLVQVGREYQGTLTDDAETLLIRNEYSCKVQFIFVGDDSPTLCTEFLHNLSHVKYWQEFGFRNISIINKRQPKFQPEKRDTKWIPRYVVDITFAFASESREKIDVIDKIIMNNLRGEEISIPYLAPPAIPHLSVSTLSDTSIRVDIYNYTANCVLTVERSADGSNWAEIYNQANAQSHPYSFDDTGLPTHGIYYYRSRTSRNGQYSAYSPVVHAYTNVESPSFGVFSMGINLAGLEFTGSAIPGVYGTNYKAPSNSEIDYFKSKGFNRIRLPIRWERLQPQLNGPFDSAYFGRIKTVVDYCASVNVKVLLDVHNYGSRLEGKIGGPNVSNENFADLWLKIATAFQGYSSTLSYDLMNEPNAMPSPQAWPLAAQAAVDAIRTVDVDSTIYIEGDNWSSAGTWTQYNDNLHINDPSNKIIYSAHCYLDRDNSGTHFNWQTEIQNGVTITTGRERIKVFTDWLEKNGYKGHIGEMGAGNDDPGWNLALDNILDFCKIHSLEVDYWTAGPLWGSYPLSTAPVGVKDATQMAVLTKYTEVGIQPNYYFLVAPNTPARGNAGEASEDWVVEYRGIITQAITVTPNDNGAGGSFTPSSVVLSPGFNGRATFKYNAPITQKIITISCTNNRSLADPQNGSYCTIPDLFSASNSDSFANNIFSFRRVFSPYTGPCIRLKREIDSVSADFGFTVDGDLDREAIQTWSQGSSLRLVRWYDQGIKKQDIQPVFSDNTVGGTSPKDYPFFILNDVDGYPSVLFDGRSEWIHRADIPSVLQGLQGQTLISRVSHRSGGRLLSWQFSNYNNWINKNKKWEISIDSPTELSIGVIDNEWHNYAGRWSANSINGKQTYRDGVLIGQQTTTAPNLVMDNNRAQINMGWFRWAAGEKWSGKVRELFIFGNTLSDQDMSAFNADIASYYSTPLPTLSTFVNSTYPAPLIPPTLPNKFKGVNLSSAEFNKPSPYGTYSFHYTYPTNAEIDYYAAKGFTLIRLPVSGARLQPICNRALNQAEVNRINNVVQYCASKNMYVVIDPHDYGSKWDEASWSNVSIGTSTGISAGMPQKFADFWSRIAHIFKNQTNVIFGLMNEPTGHTASEWKAVATLAVNAIRAETTSHLILIPGSSYTGAHSWVSSGNAAAWTGFSDVNFMFEVHQYLDSDNSGTHSTCSLNSGSTRLAAFTSWARTNNYKGFLGEFAWSADASCASEGPALVNYMTSNSDVWNGWAYWSGGPWVNQSYMFMLTPSSLSSPVDKPQMATLLANL